MTPETHTDTATPDAPPAATSVVEPTDVPADAGRFVTALAEEARRLSAEAKLLKTHASLLRPLGRAETWREPKKLSTAVARVRKRLAGEAAERTGAAALVARADEYARTSAERARREISRGLRPACVQRNLELRIVSAQEPQEVRIPPVAVVFDFARGRAEIQFAKQTLGTCAATVDGILKTRERVLAELDRGFAAEAFLRHCLRAYRLALADAGKQPGDRIEILDFLPFLALTMQDERFAVEPSAKHYKPYGRARFAYDMARLRRAGQLRIGDVRLNLGVATGTTASQKKRVIYFEDDEGSGEYKLTVFFTKVEEATE